MSTTIHITDQNSPVFATGDQTISGNKSFDGLTIFGEPGIKIKGYNPILLDPTSGETFIDYNAITLGESGSFSIYTYYGNEIYISDTHPNPDVRGIYIATTPNSGVTFYEWTFSETGTLRFPDYTEQNTAFSNPYPNIFYLTGISNPYLQLNDGTYIDSAGFYGGPDYNLDLSVYNTSPSSYQGIDMNPTIDDAINIYTENATSINNWYFTKNGEFVFPDNTKQITAFVPEQIVHTTGYEVISGDKRFKSSGIFDGGLYVGSDQGINSSINLWEGNTEAYYVIGPSDGGFYFNAKTAFDNKLQLDFILNDINITNSNFGEIRIGTFSGLHTFRVGIPAGDVALTYELSGLKPYIYNYSTPLLADSLQNKYKINNAFIGINITGIRPGIDIINLFPKGEFNKGKAYGLSNFPDKTLGRNIPITGGLYSGRYLHRAKTHPTLRNNFVNMILSSGTGQFIKPRERFLETYYNIEVPANSGTLRPLQFLTPRFSISNDPILNLTFNFEQNAEQPVVSGCYADDPTKIIFTLTGSNSYSFSQTVRMMYRYNHLGSNDGIKDGYIILS